MCADATDSGMCVATWTKVSMAERALDSDLSAGVSPTSAMEEEEAGAGGAGGDGLAVAVEGWGEMEEG